MNKTTQDIKNLVEEKYRYGFETAIENQTAPKGLNEEVIRFISAQKKEPEWLLDWRLKAYRHWLGMQEPHWGKLHYDPIDYQDLYYWAAPAEKKSPQSLDEVDPEILKTYEKLGIPLNEQKALAGVAVDAIFDSVSVVTTYKAKLKQQGILFCSISEAVRDYPDLIRKYLGSVVPYTDNFFACLNSAVFSDGSFVYIPRH
ncbi:MAG: Fe-S cluster assembly protein SufB, partial [Alphaproteobacteria bacterium]